MLPTAILVAALAMDLFLFRGSTPGILSCNPLLRSNVWWALRSYSFGCSRCHCRGIDLFLRLSLVVVLFHGAFRGVSMLPTAVGAALAIGLSQATPAIVRWMLLVVVWLRTIRSFDPLVAYRDCGRSACYLFLRLSSGLVMSLSL
jgi:hypothetical protein